MDFIGKLNLIKAFWLQLVQLVEASTSTVGTIDSWFSAYGWPSDDINMNASASKLDPSKSPSAVKYGMAELSGSILYFHMKWMRMCAV